MTIKRIIIYSAIMLCFSAALLISSLFGLSASEQKIAEVQKKMNMALSLADELRESSRNLTSAVRQFVITGDERYADEYMDIVLVRAGEKPRAEDSKVAPGLRISLDQLMRQANYSESELNLLRGAGKRSENLVNVETEAINAVRGLFPDDLGEFTVMGAPDKDKAINLVFGVEYIDEVAQIMRPFQLFKQELEERLDNIVVEAQAKHASALKMVWIIMYSVIGLFGGYLILVALVIVRPVLKCDKFALQVANGDFKSHLEYSSSNEIGSLAQSLRSMFNTLLDRIGLEEHMRYYSAVIGAVDAGVIIKDRAGRITDWNKGAENILGYKSEEIIGKTTKYYAPNESHAEIDEIQKQMELGKHSARLDVIRKHKDGRLIDCSASYTPIFDERGSFTGSVAIFHDITDKKLAEQKARRLAAIISIADAGIIVKDKNGVVEDWNIGAENILGYKPDEIIGHTTKYYAPLEEHLGIDQIEERLKKGEHTAHVAVVRKARDGRLIDCSASYTPIFDEGRNFIGSVSIFHDVTAEKLAEKKAKRLADIVSATDAGIVVKDADNNILEWNIGAQSIFGYTPEEMVGKNAKLFVPAEHHAKIDEIKERLLRGEHANHVEIVRQAKDGRLIDCSATYTPIFDQCGVYAGCITVFQDISYRKQIERELNEALLEAKEASRAKSTFLANMSHEIRTPMNGVIGFVELALGVEGLSDDAKDYLLKIKTSAESLLGIINDILDISKIEAGAVELENIPFDLHGIFRDCETISGLKAAEKNIALHFYAEPFEETRLLGDPTRLRQIMLNLLTNAIKFTHSGVVRLTALIEEQNISHVKIRFEVTDSGIGMTPQMIKKVFEPFVQADNKTTRKYGGTGLGLTITKSFVEMMGGKLKVESALGLGSKFSFTLLFETTSKDAAAVRKSSKQLNIAKPTFSGEVLVCEDNEINRQVITKNLSRIGLRYVTAENGRQGLDEYGLRIESGKSFDLILMDIHMPVMDGLEATRKLLEMGCTTPIIALTANAMCTDRNSYLKQGMSDYLSKPFTAQELWACLLRHLTPCEQTTVIPASKTDCAVNNDVINEASGIEKSADDEQLYRRLQRNFYNDNQNVVGLLAEAVDKGDLELAHRTAHTLKSTARLIGAEKLAQIVQSIELDLAIKESVSFPVQIKALESALQEVFEMLKPIGPKTEEEPLSTDKVLNKQEATRLVEQLLPLLKAGNPESIKLTNEIKTTLSSLGEVCDRLINQIDNYDFDDAFGTLREIIENERLL